MNQIQTTQPQTIQTYQPTIEWSPETSKIISFLESIKENQEEIVSNPIETSNYMISIKFTCPICQCENCQEEECDIEIDRQDYMAERWSDF
tara:strand:+ start:817 stop:1089 length:273 start_codon:yes stop_codon:yes gene_type:complete